MATVATLVDAGHNRVRYLLVSDGGDAVATTITTTGAATPDLLTDSLAGPVKQIARAFTNGLGILAAGVKTQAQSRAMWMADASDTVLGNGKVSRALARVTRRSGSPTWIIDANVDGGGHPTVIVTPSAAVASSCYVDIETQGGIGR